MIRLAPPCTGENEGYYRGESNSGHVQAAVPLQAVPERQAGGDLASTYDTVSLQQFRVVSSNVGGVIVSDDLRTVCLPAP